MTTFKSKGRILFFIFFILALSCFLLNAVDSNDVNEWENPEMIAQNKEPAHNTLMPYADKKVALRCDRFQSEFFQSLNGNWKFFWVKKPADRHKDFYKPDYDVSRWEEIQVPGNWQLAGYGIPYYLNHPYVFEKNPPFIQHNFNPVGSYRMEFEIPENWKDRPIFIHFDGVESAFICGSTAIESVTVKAAERPQNLISRNFFKKGKTFWLQKSIVGRMGLISSARIFGG